jgi:ATP-dependent Lon protease
MPVSRMDEVIRQALVRAPEPIEWDEAKAGANPPAPAEVVEDDSTALRTAH